MSPRSYRQHCGLARALDVVGERWTLLVVRELALGPRRYRDLLADLPGIGTNLLAARLRSLEAAGLVCRAVDPDGAPGYALTDRGAALCPMLEGLALWGFALLDEEPAGAAVRASWVALSMQAQAGDLAGLDGVYAFVVGDERLHFVVADGSVDLRVGEPSSDPDLRVTCELQAFLALVSRSITPAEALRDGRLGVEGDAGRLAAFVASLHLPGRPDGEQRAAGRR